MHAPSGFLRKMGNLAGKETARDVLHWATAMTDQDEPEDDEQERHHHNFFCRF
jgi:hypothetical protein